jgi:hypothetical protein
VYNVTGGNKKGGAKLAAPKDGFDEGISRFKTCWDAGQK